MRERTGRTVMQRLEDLALERAARLLTDTARPVAETEPDDVPDAALFKNRMNLDYAHGGSSIISPLGVPLNPRSALSCWSPTARRG